MNMRFLFLALFGIFSPVVLCAVEDPFNIKLLAYTGDTIFGDSSISYLELERPDINLNGDLCFKAQVLHEGEKKNAIIKVSNGVSEVVALSGNSVGIWRDATNLVSSASFATFSNPVLNDNGDVAFLAEFNLLGAQIMEESRHAIVRTGDLAGEFWVLDRTGREAKVLGEPGSEQFPDSTRHLRFSAPSFDGQGGIYYSSLVQKGVSEDAEYRNMIYYLPEPSSSATVFIQPDFVFRGESYSVSSAEIPSDLPGPVSFQIDENRNLHLIAQIDSKRHFIKQVSGEQSVLLSEGDELATQAGFTVSNLQAERSQFGEMSSYLVTATDGSEERTLIMEGEEVLLSNQEVISGYEELGEMSFLGLPISAQNGAAAFVATFKTPEGELRQSLWRKLTPGIAPRPIAIEGGQVPEAAQGVTFRSFGSPFINQIGQVVFPATLNHGFGINTKNDFGIYLAQPNRSLCRLVGEGDLFFFGNLELKEIVSLALSDMNEQGEIAVNLTAEDNSSALFQIEIPVNIVLHYDDWAITNNLSETQRGRFADPDGDGQSNFLEYAYGNDPLDANSNEAPQMRLLDDEGSLRLALEFTRLAETSELTYTVEFSQDLNTWNSSKNLELPVSFEGSPEYELVRISAESVSSAKNFVRIRVSE